MQYNKKIVIYTKKSILLIKFNCSKDRIYLLFDYRFDVDDLSFVTGQQIRQRVLAF